MLEAFIGTRNDSPDDSLPKLAPIQENMPATRTSNAPNTLNPDCPNMAPPSAFIEPAPRTHLHPSKRARGRAVVYFAGMLEKYAATCSMFSSSNAATIALITGSLRTPVR